MLKRYAYGYDPAGNRTHEQIDDAITAATHNRLNRLLTHAASGALTVAGTVNEPAVVTFGVSGAAVSCPFLLNPAAAYCGISGDD